MKKLISFLLSFILIFTLIGCGKQAQETAVTPANTQEETVQEPQINIVDKEETNTEQQPQAPPQDETQEEPAQEQVAEEVQEPTIDEHGSYDAKDDVALYIATYGHLPENYMKKKEANALGWSGGSLEKYAPGMCIGGDRFGNYEGRLPAKDGRKYTECDIDTLGAKSRGAKRIIFSNDGLIYYTEDHYETFTLLYGEE